MELLDRAAALSAHPVIGSLAPAAIVALAARARAVAVPQGAAVAVPSESVLVIAAGEVALDGGGRAGAGDALGLVEAVAGVPATERGTASTEVVAVAVLRDELLDFVAEDPRAARTLAARLAAQVRGAT